VTLGESEAQADALLGVLERALPARVVLAVYLYGSAVAGGLRPDSDLDLLAITRRRLHDNEKRGLVGGIVPISQRGVRPPGWRPLELTVAVLDEVRPWRYPPRIDFQYGEWLREDLVRATPAPLPAADPDLAIQLTMVRSTGRALRGPAPTDLLDAVPHDDLVRATTDELPTLLADLESDTRNVLLTLARMWTSAASGAVLSKDAAATWALARLPAALRPVLAKARVGYLAGLEDAWDQPSVRSVADHMAGEIRRAATTVTRLPPTDASV
jgi:predicted nucleotidyltransferase